MSILIDTGAGGGNYVSLSVWKSIQAWGASAVRKQLSVKGKRSLQAATPTGSKVPGMTILGSTVLSIVLPPDDHVKNISVRVIQGLPYAFILVSGFVRANSSAISPGKGKGLLPSPGAPWVPFQLRNATGKKSRAVYGALQTSTDVATLPPNDFYDHSLVAGVSH